MLHWREDENPERRGMTMWALFEKNSKYFDPSRAPFMLNYRVDDLDALLEALRAEGVEIDPKREDPRIRPVRLDHRSGNKIELWEPPKKAECRLLPACEAGTVVCKGTAASVQSCVCRQIKTGTLKRQTNCKNRGEFRWLKFNYMMAKAWRARSSALSERSCKRTSLRTSSGTLSI